MAAVYARVNRANTAIDIYPIRPRDLNRSCSAVAGTGITIGANATDDTLLLYLHVLVRVEDKPLPPTGGTVEVRAPAKEADGHWWVRHDVIPPSGSDLTRIKTVAKGQVDAKIAWFERMQAAVADGGAAIKARIDAAVSFADVLAIAEELNEL